MTLTLLLIPLHRLAYLAVEVPGLLIAAALGLAASGHAIWYWLDLHGLEPFPSLADAFYLAVYPLFIAALWILGKQSGRDDGALSDVLIVCIAPKSLPIFCYFGACWPIWRLTCSMLTVIWRAGMNPVVSLMLCGYLPMC